MTIDRRGTAHLLDRDPRAGAGSASRPAYRWVGPLTLVLLVGSAWLVPASAQILDVRFVAADMSGGIVLPADSEVGVSFGARVGLLDVLDRALHAGLELEWWTARRESGTVVVRDIVVGVAFWRELARSGSLRPLLGVSTSLHSVDGDVEEGAPFSEDGSLQAEALDGLRPAIAGFGALTLRLTATGAIWLLLEYRYTAVKKSPYHDLRVGARLTPSAL